MNEAILDHKTKGQPWSSNRDGKQRVLGLVPHPSLETHPPPQGHQQPPLTRETTESSSAEPGRWHSQYPAATLPGTSRGVSMPTYKHPPPPDTGRTEMGSRMEKPGSNWTRDGICV